MKKFLLTAGLLLTMLIPQVNADTIKLATLINRNGLKIVVVAGSQTAQRYFGDGFILYTGDEPNLGFTVVTNYKTTLSRSISSTASTIYVSSLTTKDGHSLTMADLGTKVFFTLEPGSNKEEIVMCTGVGTLSWSSCSRGLSFFATSTAAVTANQKSHSAGSAIVMSNVHYVYDELVDKDATETIDGLKTFTATTTFSALPNTTTSYVPAANGDLATKKYVDDTALATAPDATSAVKGVTELATGAEAAAGASAGGTTGGLVLPASIATTTANVAGNHVAITDTDGKLKQDLLDLTEGFTFTGIQNNTSFNSASSTFTGKLEGNHTVSKIIDVAINGSATPQLVAIHVDHGYVVKAQASSASTTQVFGFITTNALASSSPNIVVSGVLGGFTDLATSSEYYLSDTAGTISTTQGTRIIPVGRAISQTQLLINFGLKKYFGTKLISFSSGIGNSTSTIDIGFSPISIRFMMDVNNQVTNGTTVDNVYANSRGKSTTFDSNMMIKADDPDQNSMALASGSSWTCSNLGGGTSGANILTIQSVNDLRITISSNQTAGTGAFGNWTIYYEITGY